MDFNILSEFYNLVPAFIIAILIAAKIYFGNKFNNVVFWALMLPFVCLISITFSTAYIMVVPENSIKSSFIQNFNFTTGYYTARLFFYLNFIAVAMCLLSIIATCVYYVKTKDKNIFKNFIRSLIFYVCILILGIPAIIAPPAAKPMIQTYKLAADTAILPNVKGFYSAEAASLISNQIYDTYGKDKFPDYSSDEAQSLFSEYLKYAAISAKLQSNEEYIRIILNCIITKNYEKGLDFAKIAESRNVNVYSLYAVLYNNMGEYEKALEYISKFDKISPASVIISYCGLNEYEKAFEEVEKYKDSPALYYRYKTYIYYKSGNIQLAKECYNKLLETLKETGYNAKYEYTFEEFIKLIEIKGL
ncbi:MAG: hypothetical protein LUG16_05350 [Candidatus Gastranaerophilales bacterium]|nr:hypothetical protein [Candidatus Gastranaerophilales bacterium]